MIKIVFPALVAAISTVTVAKDLAISDVPVVVRESFFQSYPESTVEKWDFDEDDNLFEIDARKDNLEIEAKYDSKGQLIELKEDIPLDRLPASVEEKIAKQWPGASIIGINRKVKNGQVYFDVGLKIRGKHRNVQLSE